MGGCYNRELRERTVLDPQCRQQDAAPRDVMRIEQRERKVDAGARRQADTGPSFRGASPRSWEWQTGKIKVQGAPAASNYRPLSLEDDDNVDLVRNSSSSAIWVTEWLDSVESGELDVYTCLGLSNAFTWTPDTQKMLLKVFGVSVLQILVPCIMLFQEVVKGFNIAPMVANKGFRLIGFALYLYSVYSMYNNALDECRSRLLAFAIRFQLPSGYWLPLLLGEFSNVLVSIVLVLTLYVIFTNVNEPADLILNAVAVNFLGSVDAEFVNEDMKKDALENFKQLTSACMQFDVDEDISDEKTELLDYILKTMLYCIAGTGCILGFVFLVFPSDTHEQIVRGKGHV